MYLSKLAIVQYRNIEDINIELNPKINAFYANNAQGKTNVLDAIYAMGYGKSYFNSIDSQNIQHHKDFFMIKGTWVEEQEDNILHLGFKKGKKSLKKNSKEYSRLADHIGYMPVVMISPYDADLINGGSEARRKFMDAIICLCSKSYLKNLIQYQALVKQRNASLKGMAKQRNFDPSLLEIWDIQLTELAQLILEERRQFQTTFTPLFQHYYELVSGQCEKATLEIKWGWDVELSLKDNLKNCQEKDRILQHTSVGPHRDDLSFNLDEWSVKKYGSQGQQKSFLIALKLAKYEMVRTLTSKTPILLLDDVFDKLDHQRVENLMHALEEKGFGQIMVTHTEERALKEVFKDKEVTYFQLDKGVIQ